MPQHCHPRRAATALLFWSRACSTLQVKLEQNARKRVFLHWLSIVPPPPSKLSALENDLRETQKKHVMAQLTSILKGFRSGQDVMRAEVLHTTSTPENAEQRCAGDDDVCASSGVALVVGAGCSEETSARDALFEGL